MVDYLTRAVKCFAARPKSVLAAIVPLSLFPLAFAGIRQTQCAVLARKLLADVFSAMRPIVAAQLIRA